MTRKAYVHIGTHKTGTTYLQKWMLKNAASLAELGLFFPQIGMDQNPTAQFMLSSDARNFKKDLSQSEHWRTLRQQLLITDKDVILSAETFSDRIRHRAEAAAIVDFFSALNIETEFVVFLRDVPAYMNSRYVQDAKYLRLADGFMEFVDRNRADVNYNYVKLLKPFELTAPVTVLPFTRHGPLIEHRFLAAMGRSEEVFTKLEWNELSEQNPSFGPSTIRIARLLVGARPPKMSRRVFEEQGGHYRRLCNLYGLNKTGFVGCDVETANAIRAEFAPYTDAIAKKYFTKSWSETVPPEGMFERFEQSQQIDNATPQKTIDKIIDYTRAVGVPNSECPISMPRKYRLIVETETRRVLKKAYGLMTQKS